MKMFVHKVLFVTFFLSPVIAETPGQTLTMTTTQLNAIAKESMRHSDQIRFSFNDAIQADYVINEDENTCTLLFFNLPFNSTLAANLVKKIKGASSVITAVVPSKITSPTNNIEGTELKISFSAKEVRIGVQTFENPHQLVLDITSMNRLLSKINHSSVISLASNTKSHAFFIAQVRA